MPKFIRNQKGVTLVELLAGLALFGIVLTIVTSVLVQSIKYNERSENNVNLRQQANYIMTALRSVDLDNVDSDGFEVCYESSTIQFEDEQNIRLNRDLTFESININGDLKEDCSNFIENDVADVSFTLTNGNQQSFSLSTIITHFNLDNKNDNPNPEPPTDDKPIFTKKSEFLDLTLPDSGDYTNVHNLEEHHCIYNYDTEVRQIDWQWGDKCNHTIEINGSSLFKNYFSAYENYTFFISDYLYSSNSITLHGQSKIDANHNGLIKDSLNLTSSGLLKAHNLFVENDVTLDNNSRLTTSGSLRVDSGMTVRSKSTVNVSGYAFVDSLLTQENTTLNVEGNLTASGPFDVMGNAEVTIHGNAIFQDDFKFQSGTNILIEGDATFKGDVLPENASGKMCIKGSASFANSLPENGDMTVIDHASECFKPEGYNIYILNQ